MNALRSLAKSQGWEALSEYWERQVTARVGVILQPGLEHNGVNKEFLKGEIAGLDLARKMPQLLIDELIRLQEENESSQSQENQDGPAK